jgi:hypothetical protein
MEVTMDARLMFIAASALGLATGAVAEPAKSPAPATPAKERPVVLASAEVPASPAAATTDTAAPPAAPARKPRTARVTTCRCADTPNP